MRLQSWLDTCSSVNCATATNNSTISLPILRSHKQHASEYSTTSSSTSTATSDESTSSTLHTNYSIQTLPSLPSLQKLSPQNFSVSHHCLTSFTPRPSRPITSLAIHNNLLYAATENLINVYDRHTCTNLHSFNSTSSGSTKAITFSKDMLFTTHQDCKIRVWHHRRRRNHRMLTTLPTVNDFLRRFLFPKNYVTVRRHDKRLWIQHADAVTDLAVSNGVIYSVSWDKTLKIWRISDLRCVESVNAHEDAVNAVAVSNDGTVYTGSADRRIRVWAKPVGEKRHVMVATLEKHKSAVNALALNDDGSVLFSGACDRSILVWEREDSANHMVVSGALRGHQNAILCLINVSDLLLSGSADRTVRIWKRVYDGSFCCVGVLDGHGKPVKSLTAVSEYDDQSSTNGVVSVYSGSLDGEIKVWQLSIRCLATQDSDILNSYKANKIT
ncbi:protein JINGUBANG [Cicer arietinum]|uniref:Protein JINGUBANG n=1 Tax=Cicer arietinum TaxID=3827 RepID=A0A1S2YFR3_CICAR|nr:protein JINGUBANG [Cicer arietinum]